MLSQKESDRVFKCCMEIAQVANLILEISEQADSKDAIKKNISLQLKKMELYKKEIEEVLDDLSLS